MIEPPPGRSRPLDRSRPLLCFIHDADRPEIPPALGAVPATQWRSIDLLQVRGKTLGAGDLEDLARAWVDRVAGLGPRLIVNDRLDVALASGADGVHLGRSDLPLIAARSLLPPGFLLGASTRSRAEILVAQREGASYVGLGAFFTTTTKGDALGLDPRETGFADEEPGIEIPVLAIGGITVSRIAEALKTSRVTGVAVSGAIQEAPEPAEAIHRLRGALDAAWISRGRPVRSQVAG